jgi:hypothetical protein
VTLRPQNRRGSAILAGVMATAVMTILMYPGKALGRPMDTPRMLGSMVADPERGATDLVGLVLHVMMGLIFAIVYVLLFAALGLTPSWLWGAIFGAVHAGLAGLAMGMMPALPPRLGDRAALPAPGLFGRNLGAVAPMAIIIMLHVVYGSVVGGVYARLVG